MEGKFIYQSASELAAMIRSGEVSSEEVVKEHLAHIRNNNWRYNALVWLREDEALQEAELADEAVTRGDTLQPLLGVPVTIKEHFWVKGLPTASNPYDTTRTPGGSTGGGAAALTAGFTALSLGSDAGGSIRIPAVFCGLYGLKPSFGAINLTKGVMPFEMMKGKKHAQASAGPLARTARDLELYWQVLCKTPIDEQFQEEISWTEPSERALDQFTLAWMDEWKCGGNVTQVGKDVKEKLRVLLDSLEGQGVSLKKDVPDIYDQIVQVWGGLHFQMVTQDESWLVRKLIKIDISKQDDCNGNFEAIYTSLDDNFQERWDKLQAEQDHLIGRMESFFKTCDFLILPLTYGPAIIKCEKCTHLSGDDEMEMPYYSYFPYAVAFNALEQPVVVVPMGLNSAGLPIGIQIVGPRYSELELLYFTRLIEPLIPGFVKPEIQ